MALVEAIEVVPERPAAVPRATPSSITVDLDPLWT
jgi:hypothetical protein